MSNHADVIIIGGGIIGNSAAYYLAKKGLSVIVLEKSNHMGNGGSSRNGGGVRQSGRDKRELPLAMYGVKNLWPTLSEELEMDVEYYQEGNLRLGKTGGHISASWCPTDGRHANPMLATLAYYRKARQLGVRFITGEEVTGIRKIRGKARTVVTADNCYEGDTIILAAGFESRSIAATVGIDVPMTQALLEVLVTEAQPSMFYQMLGTAAADFYGHYPRLLCIWRVLRA